MSRASTLGLVAARGLAASDGWALPLAQFPDAPYRSAGAEIIWLGGAERAQDGAMHPRMVLLHSMPAQREPIRIATADAELWHPEPIDVRDPKGFVARTAALRDRLDAIGPARGLAPLMQGGTPAFPLDLAAPLVRRVAALVAAPTESSWAGAAIGLLGLGTGLTPSGDDFVGGLLFARRLLAPDAALESLEAAAAQILAAAAHRTHAVSAALLADLAHGAAYERLHAVAAALVAARDPVPAARRLVAIGHSSGWDMLTGFIVGATRSLEGIQP